MKIEYKLDKKVDIDQLLALYESVGWNSYVELKKSAIEKIVLNSHHIIQAFDGKRLIGFVRSISDGVLYAIFQDLIVHPEYQRKGIGTTLVKKILELYESFPRKDYIRLFAEPGSESFYHSLGFCKCNLTPFMVKRYE